MMFGVPMDLRGDPGRRFHPGLRRHRFFRRFRPSGAFRGLRGVHPGSLGIFLPGVGGLAFEAAQMMMGDPGWFSGLTHAVGGAGRRLARFGRRAVAGRLPDILAAAGPPIQAGMPGPPGASLADLAMQAFGGAAGPTLDDASAATGLPPDHPHTRAVHRAMGGRGRRINVTNTKALSRATRRLTGFVNTYKRTARHLGYTLHRGHGAHLRKGKRRA